MKSFRSIVFIVAFGITLVSCLPSAGGNPNRQVSLFYYNPNLDTDAADNILCCRAGLVSVHRNVAGSLSEEALIGETIRLLISGELSPEEHSQGIITEFPLEGFSLSETNLNDGVLTLSFDDPNHRAIGGACRVTLLWLQIKETALQFPGVKEVRFLPEELFQP